MIRHLIAAVVACASILGALLMSPAACQSFGSAAPGTDAESGADTATSAADAGVNDARAPDARVRSCTGRSLLDDPFTDLIGPWGGVQGSPSRDPEVGLPPPSLFAAATRQDAGSSADVSVWANVTLGGANVCVEFDAFVEASPDEFFGNSFGEVFAIAPTGGSRTYVEIKSTGIGVSDDDGHVPVSPSPLNRWAHYVLLLPYATSGGKPSLVVDGVPALLPRTVDGGAVTAAKVELGLDLTGKNGAAGPVRVRIDNFSMTADR